MSESRDESARLRINTTWPPKGRARRTALGLAAMTAAAGTVMVLSAASGSGVAGAAPSSVTLCHGTNSNQNPYVVVTVAPDSINRLIFGKNGHNSHNGPVWNPTLKAQHVVWGDIIPPFDWGKNNQRHYDGKNWDATGIAIFENGCKIPAGTTSSSPPTSTPPSTPASTPPSTPPSSTPNTPTSHGVSPTSSHRTTHSNSHSNSHGQLPVSTSRANGPIPQGVSAGLHTPIANAGLKAWGVVLMVLGGAAGLLAGLWPTRRRAH